MRVEPSSELFAGPMKALAWVSPGAVEIEVGLRTGETLTVATGGMLSLSMLGFPPGFWAGVLGFAVAVVTIFMVRREARPLRDLANAVDRMILPGKASAIADVPRGAPEIHALIAAFNRLSQRIADLLKARMALIGGSSHDLRTYATRLRLRTELIADSEERAKAVHDLDDMQRLLDDSLLAIEAGAPGRAEELVDIAPILEREAEDRRLAGAVVSLSVSPAARRAQLLGDALALRRLIANLTDNALAYGREALMSAEVEDDTLIIMVAASAPGFARWCSSRSFGSRNLATGARVALASGSPLHATQPRPTAGG